MKRINPKTGTPFRRGDVREDGKIFYGYNKVQPTKTGFYYEKWASKKSFTALIQYNHAYDSSRKATKEGHIHRACSSIKSRAKRNNLEFDLTDDFLLSIAPEKCPVFQIDLAWGTTENKVKPNSPSLDRIDPLKGYVEGNVLWMSNKANTMKQNANKEELKQFAVWVNQTF